MIGYRGLLDLLLLRVEEFGGWSVGRGSRVGRSLQLRNQPRVLYDTVLRRKLYY